MEEATTTAEALREKSISELATFITFDWKEQIKKAQKLHSLPMLVNNPKSAAAYPYLDAMLDLQKITDNYMTESGRNIVLYFLENASQYRGENAKLAKAELKRRLREECGYKIK